MGQGMQFPSMMMGNGSGGTPMLMNQNGQLMAINPAQMGMPQGMSGLQGGQNMVPVAMQGPNGQQMMMMMPMMAPNASGPQQSGQQNSSQQSNQQNSTSGSTSSGQQQPNPQTIQAMMGGMPMNMMMPGMPGMQGMAAMSGMPGMPQGMSGMPQGMMSMMAPQQMNSSVQSNDSITQIPGLNISPSGAGFMMANQKGDQNKQS